MRKLITHRGYKQSNFFFVEVTDTYGGEANYSWVKRFKVLARTTNGAVLKIRKEMGLPPAKLDGDYGDMARYNFKGTAICAFVMPYENQDENLLNVKRI